MFLLLMLMYKGKNNIWRNFLANRTFAKRSIARWRDNDDTKEHRFIVIIPSPLCHCSIIIIPSHHRVIALSPTHCRSIAIAIIITPSSSHYRVIESKLNRPKPLWCDGAIVNYLAPGPYSISRFNKKLNGVFHNLHGFLLLHPESFNINKKPRENNNKWK